MQFLFEKNIIIYTFVVLCGIGLVLRLIMNLVYNRLVSETDNMAATKNKQLGMMKMKFEAFYKLKIGVNNVDTFVDKNLLNYQFCGILLSTWDNLCGQVLYALLLIAPTSAVFGAAYDYQQERIILTGAIGILTSAILIFVDKCMNVVNKKERIKLNLLDYLDNFCRARMEKEAVNPEVFEQLDNEYSHAEKAEKQVCAAKAPSRVEVKEELNKRREEKQRREEQKRAIAMQREEDRRRMEEARKEEEMRRLEERKMMASKRREEELQKIEDERLALEARNREEKKKEEEKQQKRRQQHEDEEEVSNIVEEIAADKEEDRQDQKGETKGRSNVKSISPQEEKVIEDILKEFFA